MSYEKRTLSRARATSACACASAMLWPSTNWRPSNCTARSVAATTVRAPSLAINPGSAWVAAPMFGSGRKCLDMAMAVLDRRESTLLPLLSKSARPNWSAVSAIAVSASGTRSSASASRISASPSALEMGYSRSRLSMAQNGGGLSRTACTQGAAMRAAAAQSSTWCTLCRHCVTTSTSGRYGKGRRWVTDMVWLLGVLC